ncbi:MAG: hypothetical protein IKA06_05665 [Clostridia bacterium]|nr:hypothetical protein [Clostridia bacterium]
MAEEKVTPEVEAEAAAKPKTARKRSTASTTAKTSTATKKIATRKSSSTRKATEAAAENSESPEAKKLAEGIASAMSSEEKNESTTAKKSSTTAKKSSTAAKKSSTASKTGAAKGTATKKSTAKSDTVRVKNAASQTSAKATPEVEKEEAKAEEAQVPPKAERVADEPKFEPISNVPIALPAGQVVKARGRAVSDAHPPLDFPGQMRRNFFLRLGLILAVFTVLIISAFIYYNRPALYTEQTSSVNFLYVPEEDQTLIFVNGTKRGSAKGELTASSLNGRGDTCAAVIGGELYLIRGKNVTSIAPDVIDFVLAADGDALAYRTAPSHLYYRKTGKRDVPSLISKNCNSAAYCLSQNGKELAYTAVDTAGVSYLRVESYSSNRPYIENAAGLSPIAISNQSRYIYYTDESGALYVFDSENAQKIKCAAAPDLSSLIFNRDFTEVLFIENGGTVLFSKGERRQIVGAASTEYLQLLPNQRVASRTLANGTQYMMKSFYKNYFLHAAGTGKKLTYLDSRGNLTDVSFVDSAETVTVTDKGVYFLLTGVSGENVSRELYHVKRGKTESARIEWGVTYYCTNIDGSRVLFTGYEDALYVYRAETGTQRICDSIIANTLTVTSDDLFCFYREEGVLTVCDNGGELRDIATGVVHFAVDTHVLYYATEQGENGTFTVYANYRNERLCELVATGVSKLD